MLRPGSRLYRGKPARKLLRDIVWPSVPAGRSSRGLSSVHACAFRLGGPAAHRRRGGEDGSALGAIFSVPHLLRIVSLPNGR